MTHDTTWMRLEDVSLSEISQSHKNKYCMILFTQGIKSSQTHRNRKYNGGCQGLGEEEKRELMFNGYRDER